MSSSIFVAFISTLRTSKMRFSSCTSTHASVGCFLRIGESGWPVTGSALITPITGFLAALTCAIARVMSYSSSRSRSGVSTGMADFWSRKETASPR